MRESGTLTCGQNASLANALDRYFITCAAVAAAGAAIGYADHAQAAVVYSGPQNLAIPSGPPGLYIDLVTNASSLVKADVPGWDVNPYISASNFLMYTPAKLQIIRSATAPATSADAAKLTSGASIGPSSTFVNYSDGFMDNASGAGDWSGAGTGFMGVKITEAGVNGGNPMFGWVQITKNAGIPAGDPTGITFVDWAYDNSGAAIAAGDTGAATPEPSSLALLAAGAAGLMVRRRGRAKVRA